MAEASARRSAADPPSVFRPILKWIVTAPKAGSSAALRARFPDADELSAAAAHASRVRAARHYLRDGGHCTPGERMALCPAASVGRGRLPAHCRYGARRRRGNHIGEPFDIDVFNKVTEHIETKTISLPFQRSLSNKSRFASHGLQADRLIADLHHASFDHRTMPPDQKIVLRRLSCRCVANLPQLRVVVQLTGSSGNRPHRRPDAVFCATPRGAVDSASAALSVQGAANHSSTKSRGVGAIGSTCFTVVP